MVRSAEETRIWQELSEGGLGKAIWGAIIPHSFFPVQYCFTSNLGLAQNNWTTSHGASAKRITQPVEWQNDGQDTAGHSTAYIFWVGLEAPDGSKTTSRLPSVQGTHAKLTQAWKRPLL